ncbi:MAG: RIP metalloprotease RseP [Cryomorphaceae bacterium]|nr:RIP metalloprotease RseP [Cryomorphaceae bacterium]
MDILVQASQFILSLSLLIVLHELGHFIPAKIFKTRVEKFYLFFDPWFSLVKKKIGDTEYGIGWLPLGGYVKISGMVDESMDTEQLKKEPEEWEFRSKPAWQRLIIMIGGVTVNIIVALAIFFGMLMYWGEEYLPNEEVKYGVSLHEAARGLGLEDGDKILRVNGNEYERFNDIPKEIVLAESGTIEVERNGEILTLEYSDDVIGGLLKIRGAFITPRFKYYVGAFVDGSAAKAAGLEVGDRLLSLNGEPMEYFDQYVNTLPSMGNQTVTVEVERDGRVFSRDMDLPESGLMGVYPQNFIGQFKTEVKTYSFFEAIPASFTKSKTLLTDYIRQFKLITNPKTGAYKEVGGFIMIANQFDTVWNWQRFWSFTAFLSIMLAFLNILPIPALDGGHVVFVLWEMASGKKPSTKVLENAQMVGFFILIGLVILANGNDIMRLLGGN